VYELYDYLLTCFFSPTFEFHSYFRVRPEEHLTPASFRTVDNFPKTEKQSRYKQGSFSVFWSTQARVL